MKFLQVMMNLSLSLLLLLPFLVVESSSSADNTFFSNITRGSSLSTNDPSPYWLSPSGNIAFGFYRLPCMDSCSSPNWRDRYVVGIWFAKSPQQTLVWTANTNDPPLNKPSTILFTNDGKLVLKIMPDNKEKLLLPDVPEPALYAKMHDNGNFVLYGSDSQTLWESFDYPTDTILGGQKLKAGIDLISGDYRLSIGRTGRTDSLVAIYSLWGYQTWKTVKVVSDEIGGSLNTPVTLNLDITGNLCLVGSDDVVLKCLFRNQEGSIVKEKEEAHLYRATLDSEGHFNLYKERIDGNISSAGLDEKISSSNLKLLWPVLRRISKLEIFQMCLVFIVFNIIRLIVENRCRRTEAEKEKTAGADLESGKTCPMVREGLQESEKKEG